MDLDGTLPAGNDKLDYDANSQSTVSLEHGEAYCNHCKQVFASESDYVRHSFRCSLSQGPNTNVPTTSSSRPATVAMPSPTVPRQQPGLAPGHHVLTIEVPNPQGPASTDPERPVQNIRLKTKPPIVQPMPPTRRDSVQPVPTAAAPVSVSGTSAPVGSFTCSAHGCGKTFRSAPALKVHQGDTHGIGGQKLDIHGRDSWMLGQRERERLRAEGLLRAPSGSPRGRGGRSPPVRSPQAASAYPSKPAFGSQIPASYTQPPHVPIGPRNHAPQHTPAQHTAAPPGMNVGGPAEMEQAKHIQGKILRLLIQSDIFIKNDGKINVCGIDWTRIGVFKQPEVPAMFDSMCHLPKALQDEYLPAPMAFKGEYISQYDCDEFGTSPARDFAKPGMDLIVLSCSKVVLANGCQEIVKIAAIDLLTCRILMNHLVCTDPRVQVADWRSPETGVLSWHDVEAARQAGYKVFKGWSAARSTLYKFIDKETIIVGHNLRADLDALRIIHGRAVDIAKVVEKAAKGPLSKAQLGLDSLCRNYAGAHLKSDAEYGRDVLMNAFAVREFALWVVKNQDALNKDAKQKSLDYQKIMPKSAIAV